MLRQNLITLIFILLTFSSFAQVDSLPMFKENLPKDLKENSWLLTILKNNFNDFIATSSNSVWSEKDYVQVIASRNDSAFAGTIIRSSVDTSMIEINMKSIDVKVYNLTIDTLRLLGFFELKDEKQVSPCELQKKERINGKLVVTSILTYSITDGTQTIFFMYSKSSLRFAGYYQLDKVKEICPNSKTWQKVVAIDNYIDTLIKKHGS